MQQLKANITYIFTKAKADHIDDSKRQSYKSSYQKQGVDSNEVLKLNQFGFENDTQGDRVNHGGIDKAVCVYPLKYYDFFKTQYNLDLPLCAFGENLTIEDLDDSDFCIGDTWGCGEVIFEVSQPRQPCWKISSMINVKNLTSLLVKENKSGFYLRVIQNGEIHLDDTLELLERKHPNLSIEYINKCAFDAKNNQENIKDILKCDSLAKVYSDSLFKRYKQKEKGLQDWQKDSYSEF
jgi:MOSC domain-containing protein YiiM